VTRYLIVAGGIVAALALYGATAFFLGRDVEQGQQMEDRLEGIEQGRQADDEVNRRDDDALRDGILRNRGR